MTPVMSSDVAAALVRRAAVARACEATAMNATSSRSHSVFMLAITGRHEASGTTLRGALNLVDLAGRCVLSTWKQGEFSASQSQWAMPTRFWQKPLE